MTQTPPPSQPLLLRSTMMTFGPGFPVLVPVVVTVLPVPVAVLRSRLKRIVTSSSSRLDLPEGARTGAGSDRLDPPLREDGRRSLSSMMTMVMSLSLSSRDLPDGGFNSLARAELPMPMPASSATA
jgi:hypothetical protein